MEVCRQRAKPGGQAGSRAGDGLAGRGVRLSVAGSLQAGLPPPPGVGQGLAPARTPSRGVPIRPSLRESWPRGLAFLGNCENCLSLRFLSLTFHLLVTPSQAPISSGNCPEATGALGVAVCPSLT